MCLAGAISLRNCSQCKAGTYGTGLGHAALSTWMMDIRPFSLHKKIFTSRRLSEYLFFVKHKLFGVQAHRHFTAACALQGPTGQDQVREHLLSEWIVLDIL
jgi:hypothetical protein